MPEKLLWVRADIPESYDQRKKIISSALEDGYTTMLIREEDKGLRRLGRYDALTLRGTDIFREEEKVGAILRIGSASDLKKASAYKDKVQFLLIDARDWKVIPLENLIAEFRGSQTKLLATASTVEEAKLFSETMECGADGIVIVPKDGESIESFSSLRTVNSPKIALTAVPITKIGALTIGDRVCVDTCSMMSVGEGMLVGSQSSCLFLINSESMESEYVSSRPFRVNAGAVHAYVLLPSGKTKYLAEIRGGDEVLAVDVEGNARPVVVGRSKVERRPLLLIEVDVGGKRFSTILQNAETIRMCTPDGPISVSDLKPGQKVLVKLEEGGRHFGHSVKETITEI